MTKKWEVRDKIVPQNGIQVKGILSTVLQEKTFRIQKGSLENDIKNSLFGMVWKSVSKIFKGIISVSESKMHSPMSFDNIDNFRILCFVRENNLRSKE